jgi:hypothetical protein
MSAKPESGLEKARRINRRIDESNMRAIEYLTALYAVYPSHIDGFRARARACAKFRVGNILADLVQA